MSNTRMIGMGVLMAPLWHKMSFIDACFVSLGLFIILFTIPENK